jgi:hypothetical protein
MGARFLRVPATEGSEIDPLVEQSRYRGGKPRSSFILFAKGIILKYPIPGTLTEEFPHEQTATKTF